MAYGLGSKIFFYFKEMLRLDGADLRCYTDSTVSLHWIKRNPIRWKAFVANRVTEIRGLVEPAHWYHCPGKDNPVDLVTRGLGAEQLVQSSEWLEGPRKLMASPSEEVTQSGNDLPPECVVEERGSKVHNFVSVSMEPVLQSERHS